MKLDKPTFENGELLVRYIEPGHRQASKRPSPTAFMEDDEATQNGLSVNSVAVHSEGEIAQIYSVKFDDPRPVALSVHTVADYNAAAKAVNLAIEFNHEAGCWCYSAAKVEAYKHDPRTGNISHCLVKYTVHFDEAQKFRFAVRMAYKPTYKFY